MPQRLRRTTIDTRSVEYLDTYLLALEGDDTSRGRCHEHRHHERQRHQGSSSSSSSSSHHRSFTPSSSFLVRSFLPSVLACLAQYLYLYLSALSVGCEVDGGVGAEGRARDCDVERTNEGDDVWPPKHRNTELLFRRSNFRSSHRHRTTSEQQPLPHVQCIRCSLLPATLGLRHRWLS